MIGMSHWSANSSRKTVFSFTLTAWARFTRQLTITCLFHIQTRFRFTFYKHRTVGVWLCICVYRHVYEYAYVAYVCSYREVFIHVVSGLKMNCICIFAWCVCACVYWWMQPVTSVFSCSEKWQQDFRRLQPAHPSSCRNWLLTGTLQGGLQLKDPTGPVPCCPRAAVVATVTRSLKECVLWWW